MAHFLTIEGRQVPVPSYKHDLDDLVRAYQDAMLYIKNYLLRQDIANMTRANARAMLKEIYKRLQELDLFAEQWVQANVPIAAQDGVAAALVNLGIVETLKEADSFVKFNKLNKALVETAIADTQDDLLAVTNNVRKKVRNEIRKATSEVMRENMARGVNGNRTLNNALLGKLRERLGATVETGIVDVAKRRWAPEDYVEMLTRTKMLETYRQSQTNEAIDRGALYGIIGGPTGSKDSCRFHVGRIIKLTPSAAGPYPTYEELKASNQIFHPRCRHHFTVLRDPSLLGPDTLNTAESQAKRGNAALATGKRNPSDIK